MKRKINRIRRRSGIVGILLLLILIMYVWIGFPKESRITAFDNEEVQDLQGSVYASCNGEEIKTVLPGKITAKAGDTIVIRRKLDEDSVLGNTILFYCKQAHIRVYLDEERIWEDPDRSLPFPMLEGSYWRLIRMPASYEGKELCIEIVPQVNQYAGELPAIYTGTKASLVYMVVRQGIVFLLLGLIAVILGVAILIMGLIMRHEGVIASRMCYLGLLAVITGIWGVLEARVTQLFTGNIPRASFVLFACFSMLPVLITAFVLTYESLRDQWYMKALFYLAVANFVAQQILQITGVLYYMQMIAVVHILFVLILCGLIAGFFTLRRSREAKKDYFIYKAMLILALFGMGDLVWYYLFPAGRVGIFLRIGILFLIAYLGYDTIRQIGLLRIQEAKNSFYKELAYTDIMTGLNNRTAYENRVEKIRKVTETSRENHEVPEENEKKKDDSWIIMIADMNCLKVINDEHGHDKGDEAIFKLASHLKKYFGPVGECFRIGGDEFCVLAPDIREERFEEICQNFRAALEKEDQETTYPFSASMGYVLLDESGIDECVKKADQKMYEEKRRKGRVRL
jgi:diguanylate cyclase (GGDEF)-like protein